MTRINSSEHVLLLLRERLQRLDRGRGSRTGKSQGKPTAPLKPVERLQALAALDQATGEEFRRTLVRALLSEEVGEDLANDPAFGAMAEEVFQVISATPEGRELIERAAEELRAER